MTEQAQAAQTEAADAAPETVEIKIGLKNALDALAPDWATTWNAPQVNLARSLYAMGLRDSQIFANKSLENMMEGYQAAQFNLSQGLSWLSADLDAPAAIQAQLAEQAKAAALPTQIDLGAADEAKVFDPEVAPVANGAELQAAAEQSEGEAAAEAEPTYDAVQAEADAVRASQDTERSVDEDSPIEELAADLPVAVDEKAAAQ